MNDDRLRLDLAALADDITPVDLRDRALRTSRRLGIQRVVATSAAVFVLIGAATGTALAMRPDASAPMPLPGDSPSVTVTPPAEPSPSLSSPPPSVNATAPIGGPSASTVTAGRFFYGPRAVGEGSADPVRLYTWQPGSDPTRLLALSRSAAMLNAAVSPDGQRIAWVDDDAVLWVADRDGSDRRELRDDVDGQCWGPAWSPDSRRLTIGALVPDEPGAYRTGTVDVSSGRFTETGPGQGCHPVWSGNGRTIAYADGSEGRVVLAGPDGSNARSIPNLGGDARYNCFDLASLSPTGDRIALYRRGPDVPSGDVARELDANVVLDTRTGKEVALPLGGRELRQAYFQADGTLVARVESGRGFALVLVGADGRKAGEVAEPASLRDMQILAVTG
ncbi:hypothetical protein NCC78_06020 [Micromonospora phytophila]|uniref:TolB family protein n=1 Tax=Micromonospora phytophila TaxID=709888 RepID=UPI00202F1293|nr:hypothetical protein [Micromonospora phytophila]MCM0674245.1 hypothetical protein [Micromonospora phytophila]